MGKIKNLIFDFGKVLVDYEFSGVLDKYVGKDGKEHEFLDMAFSDDFARECDLELVPWKEMIAGLKMKYPQAAHAIDMFDQHYQEFIIGEMPGMREVLASLKEQGYKLYGLTNWCSKVYETMDTYAIFQLLDGRVISSEEHLVKPDVAIYQTLLERFNLNADECLFADDKKENIEGASKLGIDGIVFHDARQYVAELGKRGIVI